VTVPDYDAVIVGSGFGGSVAAFRLADAGERVLVLERGQAYAPGDFPRSPREFSRAFWDPSEGRYGFYNVWSFPGLGALVASGLGGGSLIYANVLLRKDPDTFVNDDRERWPLGYGDLEPHYERVEAMLRPQPYPFEHEPYRSRTRKTAAMAEAAESVARRIGLPEAGWELPPLAVTFGNPGEVPRPGAPIRDAPPSVHERPHPRLTCLLVGECAIGCNHGAKNTLDLTYLGHARARGAEIRTSCEVTRIAPSGDGGYLIHYLDHGELVAEGRPRRGLAEQAVSARRLVLSAGTFGSTFLLLRSQAGFPDLSRAVGGPLSANGDLLTFLIRARRSGGAGPRLLESSYGPVITSAIRVPSSTGRRGHYVEDAGYPALVSWLVQLATLPGIARRSVREKAERALERLVGRGTDTDLGDELADALGDGVLSATSMPLLSMGRDVPSGRFRLDPEGRLTTTWARSDSEEYFAGLERTLQAIAAALGAELQDSRIPGLTQLVTVHPLGGCAMADDPAHGVVDAFGEVHGCPGFFIADGSVMPGAVGPNPSLTIAALADRICDRMLGLR
jgi:cholesterol oxidase